MRSHVRTAADQPAPATPLVPDLPPQPLAPQPGTSIPGRLTPAPDTPSPAPQPEPGRSVA